MGCSVSGILVGLADGVTVAAMGSILVELKSVDGAGTIPFN